MTYQRRPLQINFKALNTITNNREIRRMIRSILFLVFLLPFEISAQADLRISLLADAIPGEIIPIRISIYSGNMNGRMNLSQTLPESIIVNEQNSAGGLFSYSEGTLQIQWLDVNPHDSLFVEYSLFINNYSDKFASINSQISGYENGISKQIEFNDFKFEISDSKQSTSNVTKNQSNKTPKSPLKPAKSGSLNPAESNRNPGTAGIHFSIQLGAFRNAIEPAALAKQYNLKTDSIRTSVHKGLNKFYYGYFTSKEEATEWLQKHPQLTGKTFIVAFNEDERIELDEAIEKLKEK